MRLPAFCFLSILFIINVCLTYASHDTVIEIENGKISGEKYEDFYAFRGIPYAQAPIGSLRFAAPKPYVQKWENVKEFKDYKDSCAQYNHFGYVFEGSEDCLFLNVFVPKTVIRSSEKVPVIFYIHGGAFMFGGSSAYWSDHIMESQNMVLVTVNYRLGVLGFLSTEDEVLPGNFGMKDQVEALKWVQRNIEAFNGDPEKVTLSGYSAGGASVQLHYMSQLTEGLFNNGISHSGVAINPWVMQENAKRKAHELATNVECPIKDHKELLNCLRSKPAEDLVMFASTYQPFLYNPFSPFAVVVEPQSDSAFITDHPLNLLKEGKFKKLPWILSQTQDEGLYPAAEFYHDDTLKVINDQWDEFMPFILDFNETTTDEKKKNEVSKKIRDYYIGQGEISKESYHHFIDIISDRIFKHGAYKAIQLQSKFSQTFFYYFRFKSLSGLAEFMAQTKDNIGISHGEDVLLIFHHGLRDVLHSEDEKIISSNLIKMYHSFAANNSAVYSNHEMEECKPDEVKYLVITATDDHRVVGTDPYFGNVQFWDEIDETLENERKKSSHDEL